jgi:hypothetical protein
MFILEMKDNRPNCHDAGMARRILEELARRAGKQASCATNLVMSQGSELRH